MFVEAHLKSVLVQLGSLEPWCRDIVTPSLQPVLASNTYREEYAWQYGYERSLLRRAKEWLEPHRTELIGSSGLLSEALSNAFAHGNQRNPLLPITVFFYVSERGYLLRVEQSGPGFDVEQVLRLFRGRKSYFSFAGNGFRRFEQSLSFRAFFESGGLAFHLWHDNSEPAVRSSPSTSP